MVNVAVSPALTVLEDGEAATEKSMLIPDSPAVCGLPAALSVIVSVALRVPEAVGAKLTGMVQLAPALTLAPQLSAPLTKSPAFAPPMVMLLMVSVPVPGFVSVTFCAALVVPMA